VRSAEALALGLVQRVLPGDELLPATHELAVALAARPTLALGWTKRLLRAAEESPLGDVMELEAQLQAAAVQTRDHAEGVAAFLEKREPRFEGH
jgi:2-(1,2-epoxy-1,2-dihydrophenyl)acetyl-CoA isomerase